ncbi:MAG: NADH-quinone oxidoreductase subunit A [Sulfolobaceae archaeon]|jgi:NADH-quinone oxidoreductase subunit A|nr:NADH-quinone oxidoreductase subunit A [Stygiolobus sp.]MDT7876193.1 NADH-quinone oxidoreductase subunit A [Sulfolobaceae archaeon]
MAFTQAMLAFGLPTILFLLAGYGGYKILSLAVEGKFNPLKVSRFEAGNIPFGEGRLWYPLQYYGYLLVYTSIEPIIVILLAIAEASYYSSFILFRNLLILITSTIVLLYPVLYYAVKQVNVIEYWLMRR